MSRFVLTFVLAFPLFVTSQVANDDCSNALPLGTLPNPANCGNGPNNDGQGDPVSFTNLTNVGSTTENPYTTLTNCQGSGQNMASPATDVWYSFVPTGLSLDITINGSISNPNVALWTGSCGSLIGAGCDIGSGGSLSTTIDQLNPGQTYYLQISGGDPSDEGTFDLTLQNNVDCEACLLTSTMTVDPLPFNGTYQPGTVVTFCFTVDEWNQTNTNWFHGVVPIMGSSWTNLTPISSANNCDGGPGVWDWFTSVSTPMGNVDGFFFDGNPGPDGNPINNFGDNCEGSNLNWEFCWQATVEDCPPGQTGDDLSVNVETYGDGETGNWSDLGCNFDPVFLFSASLACCASPLITATDVSCQGLSDGDATAEAQTTASPWDFEWQDDSGNIISTTNNSNSEFNSISNLTEGTYTVTVTDANGCVSSATITVSGPAPTTPLFDPISDICNGASFTLPNTSNNGINGSWSPVLNNTVTTTYTFTPDPGQCALTTDLTVVVIPNPADPIVSTGAATCTADGTATIDNYDGTLTYTFTPAGPTAGVGGVISGMTPGTSYDVIADDGSCSSGASTFSVDPQLIVPADPIVSSGAATCTADGTATIDNYDGTLTYTFTPAGPTAGVGGVISGMTPGTSYDVVADDGSCSSGAATFSVDPQLTVPADPIVSTGAATCTADGTATIDNYDGTLTYTFTPAGPTAGVGGVISGMTPGTSYDVIADDGSCSSGASTFSVDPQLIVPADPIVSSGAATCTADGTATIDNYDGTLTYTFTPAGPTAGVGGVISGMTPGTSYDVVADDGSCSSGAATFSVDPQLTVPADPIVSTGAATCTADGTATIDNYDGTLTYTFTPAEPTANVGGVITGTLPGTSYTVVADDGVCSSNASNAFTVDAQLPTPTITLTPNDPSACNGTDGSILVSGFGSGTVTWSGAASGTDNAAVLNYTIQNLGAGTYDVFFVDGSTGCQSSTESTLLNNPGAPIVDPINSVNNCGTDYTLDVITGSDLVDPQYYDAPGGPSGGGNIVLVGTTYIAPTDITLYAYDQNGICISEQIFTVLIEELPTVTSVNGGNTYCVGDTPADITADVTGNGPWTIDYTVDGVAQIASGATSPINLGNAPGVYVVTNITDATCNNTATGTQTIDFYTMPTVSAVNGGADYCPGDVISDIMVDVTGNGPWTIDFTLDGIAQSASGATSPINLGNAPGVYVITNITDANCTDIASGTQTINVNPIPTITLTPSDPTVCNGADGSILVSGTGSGTVTWSGSASGTDNSATLNYNISNLGAGSYDIFFIDGTTGCQSVTESTILNNPSAPVAPIISTNAATCTADGSATIDNYDGTLTYTFTPAGPTVGGGGVISGLIFGASYTVQADDGNCLSAASSSFSIDAQFPTPIISLTPNDPSVCNGTDGSILVSGVGSGTVTWNGIVSGNDNTAVLNYSIIDLGAGSYDVFFIDGTTGCQSATESAELNNPGAPSLDALSSTTACDTYTLPAITGTNLSGNQSYYTQSNGAGTPLSEGDVVSSTQTIYIYDILGTCADESSFTITIDYTPSLTNPGPQEACESFNLPLSIDGTNLSGNENYYSELQSNGGTVITDAITSSQTVYIYDANGICENEISFEVTINPLPSLVSFTGEGTYCEGDDVNNLIVEVSGAPDYTLDYTLNGNPTTISSSNSSINLGNTSGVYILTALNDNNCGVSLDATQTITINSIPDMPYLTGDSTYCENAIPIDMEATGSSGFYTWYEDNSLEVEIGNTSNLSPYIVLGSTSYYVTATENDCEGLPAEITIIFETCEIIIPTAFTPDNDMVNDTWELGNIDEIYPNNVVSIYNRWGNKLFESIQGAYNTNPWNGTFKDQALPVGSYYYIIEFNDNYTQNSNGIVSILKN